MKRIRPSTHGWLALDKPLGLTSTQALGRARRLVEGSKAGHGGTLDPLATGILPLAFGEATKLIPYIMDGEKTYEFTVRWGESRSTDDSEGSVIATSAVRPDAGQIRAALPAFTGALMQRPPAFSAIKLQGERAYDLARAGVEVEIAPREIIIHQLDLIDMSDADHASFRVACGKGMYVRSLARDLAQSLGSCGYVSQLRRTRVGPFTLAHAATLEQLETNGPAALLPIKQALAGIPTLALTPAEVHTLRLGQQITIRPAHGDLFNAPLIFAEHQGVPVAVVEAKAGSFKILRGFHFS